MAVSVYSSSAGSGKTWTLAKEYLSLVLRDPYRYQHILGVTFTNKATAEMKERILKFLHQLATQHLEADPLKQVLLAETGLSPESLTENAERALNNILHDYTRFSISTIDSFFQRIVRTFARELSVGHGFRVELDQERILDTLIDRLLLRLDDKENPRLLHWLSQLAESRLEDGKRWDFREDIKPLARLIFSEHFREFEAQLNQAEGISLPDYLSSLKDRQEEIKEVALTNTRHIVGLWQQAGLTHEDFAYKWPKPLFELAERGFTHSAYKAIVGKRPYLLGEKSWTAAKSPHKTLVESLQPEQEPLADEMLGLWAEWQTCRLILAQVYVLGILGDLAAELRNLRAEENLMLLSDTGPFLRGLIGENDAPFLYERTGSTYHHFFLDEFQDTSQVQWQNLLPLLNNSLAEDQPNLIVGDVKQSIYRWRNGDWKLLFGLSQGINREVEPSQIRPKNLNANYRSLPQVVAFNNALYATLPRLLVEQLTTWCEQNGAPELSPEMAQHFGNIALAYGDSRQEIKKSPAGSFEGYAEIRLLPPTETEAGSTRTREAWRLTLEEEIPRLVEEYQSLGYQAGDICFLVRKAEQGAQIVEILQNYKASGRAKPGVSYEVVSQEALTLGASSEVRCLIAALRFLKLPTEALYKMELGWAYAQRQAGFSAEAFWASLPEERSPEALSAWLATLVPEAVLQNRVYFNKLSLYEALEVLKDSLKLGQDPGERVYIEALLNQAWQFGQNTTATLGAFLDWWDERGYRKSVVTTQSPDALQIMTVHKSKGLEFPAVIMPWLTGDLGLVASLAPLLWVRPQSEPFNGLSTLPVRAGKDLLETEFADTLLYELGEMYLDNLNILYVATTRAAEVFVGLAPQAEKVAELGKLNTWESVWNYLAAAPGDWGLQVLEGKGGFYTGQKPGPGYQHQHKKEEGEALTLPKLGEKLPWRDVLAIRPRSQGFFSLEEEKERRFKINTGTLVHKILAEVHTEADLERVVRHYHRQADIPAEQYQAIAQRIADLLKNPQMKDWFSARWQVLSEQDILLPGQDLQTRRPDRVLVHGPQAVVIDFKSGKPQTGHKSQVREYMRLLQAMGYTQVEGFLVYLTGPDIVPVTLS